jgi:hypothetical protein
MKVEPPVTARRLDRCGRSACELVGRVGGAGAIASNVLPDAPGRAGDVGMEEEIMAEGPYLMGIDYAPAG